MMISYLLGTQIAAMLLMVFMGLLAYLNLKFYKELQHGGTDFH